MQQYQQIKEEFERNLAAAIRNTCQAYQLKPVFYAMHTFTVGGDDREFNRRFITAYLDGLQASYQPEPSSVDSIIDAMLNARLCICMRFHSVVFAHNLDRPFVAIDYTNGGKIKALLQDNGLLERLVSLQDIGAGQLHLIEERLSKQLEQSAPIQGEVDLGCDQKMRF
jgi:polysaccharide pyruvyl transferase WcaK-like protein